jgi:DNA polymerase III subunit gamma/tau
MSLYQKYRPTKLERVKGNEEIKATLSQMLSDKENAPHAFLFYGETGCGKTTLARIVATQLGCDINSSDYSEINFADLRGIDTIREIIKQSQYQPIESDSRIWVLDECQKMTGDAQNALLKILEDPPAHVYFILCTTEPQKLIATIKGRCSQFQVKPLNDEQMKSILLRITKMEGEELEEEIYEQIISNAKGKARNAIQILEQVLNVSPDFRIEIAKKSEQEINESIELCRALIKRASWKVVATILRGLKDQEAESIRRVVLGYCQSILLSGKDEPLCGLILEEFTTPFYDSGFPQLVYACYSVTKN